MNGYLLLMIAAVVLFVLTRIFKPSEDDASSSEVPMTIKMSSPEYRSVQPFNSFRND